MRRVGDAFGCQVLAGLGRDVQRQAQRHLVLQGQRRHGHAGLQTRDFDGAWVHAFGHHGQAFHHIGGEHARGVEAALVVDHDGGLADLQHIVEAARQGLVRGLGADDDLDQRHLVDRREEVQADEVGRTHTGLGQAGDGQRGGVGREHGVRRDDGFGLLRAGGLDVAVFKHRFDDQVAALEVVVRGRGLDAGQQRIALLGRAAAARDGLVQEALRVGLALVGVLLRGVEQHDVDAGLGRDVGDARAHHAGAQDADLLHLGLGDAFGTRLAFLDGVELVPQRADHVLRNLRDNAGGEVARLDLRGGIEVQQAALEQAAHDVGERRVVAVRLGVGHGRGNGQHLHHGRALAVATGDAEALGVPRRGGLGVGQAPGLGLGNELIA